LPSGDVRLSLRIGAALDRSKSESDSTGTLLVRRFRRDELTSQANLNLPLPTVGLGEISADLTAGYRTHSDAGSLENYGTALNWNPIAGVSLRASFTLDELPTLANLLNDPIVLTQNVRAYDFLRQETVLVTLLTGGNPDLLPQQRKSSKLELTYSASRTLSLNAEYNHIITTNAVAALPPASAETQSAFPDRYIRDLAGRLVRLDARAISFQRDQVDAITWGIDFRRTFRGSGRAPDAASAPDAGLRMALRADHTWFLTSTRRARPGLDAIDLLDGGALGYGGGQTKHLVRTSLAFNYQGVGLQVFGNWDSGSKVNSGPIASPDVTIFSPRMLLDLRIFANLSPRFPGRDFARNARLSLEVENLLDSRLRVYDQNGTTPVRYQPFLLDPIGRSVKLTLRKAF
jgi:hypothetical protein